MVEILTAVAAILWPISLLVIALRYSKPLFGLLDRTTKGEITKGGIKWQTSKSELDQLEESAKTLKEVTNRVERIFEQEKTYPHYVHAFSDAEDRIEQRIKDSGGNGEIHIKILAVAMTFSWNFISTNIPKILDRHQSVRLRFSIVFVSYEHLGSVKMHKTPELDWKHESMARILQIVNYTKSHKRTYGNRLIIDARVCDNLPHWHGILVDDEYLFLGRSNWSFEYDEPELSVGQNEYRYFDISAPIGLKRVELFQNWHRYYFEHASRPILSLVDSVRAA